jgi:hypothetical protein
MPVARKLNVLWGTRWFFNRHPVVAFLISLFLSPLFMWLNDYLIVWGRILPFSYQWLSALFDSLLDVGIGVMLWNLRKIPFADFPRFIQWLLGRRLFHVGLILFWVGMSLLHVYQERGSVNTWERRGGPNSIYHTVPLFPFLGYVYTLLLIVTVVLVFARKTAESDWRHIVRVGFTFVVAFTIGWAWLWAGVKFDTTHQKAPNGISKHEFSNPRKPWCNGKLTVHICGPAKGRAPIK